MLKIRLLLSLLLVAIAASAQVDTSKLTFYRFKYGIRETNGWFDRALIPPSDTTNNKKGIALVSGVFYTGNGTYWSQVTGEGGTPFTPDMVYVDDFGADGVGDDAFAFQAMFDYMEDNRVYKWGAKRAEYTINTRVTLPQTMPGSATHKYVEFATPGVIFKTTAAISMFYRQPADGAMSTPLSNYKVWFRGATFKGDGDAGQKAIEFGNTTGSIIENCVFELFDTAIVARFWLEGKISHNFFINNKVGILGSHYDGLVSGATKANSAFNSNVIDGMNEFYMASGAYAAIVIQAGDGNVIRDFIIEGNKPTYGIYADHQQSTNSKHLLIENGWWEASGSPGTIFYLDVSGITTIRNIGIKNADADTLFKIPSTVGSNAHISIENIPYVTNLAAKPFNAGGEFLSGRVIEFKEWGATATTLDPLTPSKWYGDVTPLVVNSEGSLTANGGKVFASTGEMTIKPRINTSAGNRYLNIDGGILFDVDDAYPFGRVGSNNSRATSAWFGSVGVRVANAGSYAWNEASGTIDLELKRYAQSRLGVMDGEDSLANLIAKSGAFTHPTGYDTNFVITEVNDSSFVTKSMLETALTGVIGDGWGEQRVVGDSTLFGGGTEATDDTLRVNLDVVAGKAWVRDTIAAIGAATGDEWGDQNAEVDNYTVKGNGDETPLRTDTTVIIPWSAWDSLKLSVPGSDKFPTIDSTDNSPLGTGSNTFPTSAAVRAAIDAAVVQSGTTLTGWYNILDIGGVSDAGFGSGTNNDAAWTFFVNNAPEGSMLYIPRGKYRFNSPLAIPSGKRLYVWQEGDIYVNSGNGYLVDGTENRLWIHGKILGTNQDITTPTYNSQTNYGIWLRNGGYNKVYVNEIFGFKYAIQLGGYATGTSTVQGQQYSEIHFSFLRRNSVGIYHHPDGGTTNSRGNWDNQNYIYGGRIAGDTGIVFRPDATQDDQFNGNYHYNIGFEGAYTGANMKVGIYGQFGRNNVWSGWRFESCDDPIVFTNTFDNSQFIGGIISVDELHSPGNNTMFNCELYEPVNGITVGMRGQGYTYNASNTFYNGRVRIWGTRLSPSVASALPANIDADWEVETDATVSSSTYTVAKGISTVFVNYASGTSTITLPAAASFPNRKITIKNISTANNVTVSGPTTNQTTSLTPGMASTYESSGTAWYDVTQKPAGSGDGIFDPDTDGYTTPYKIGVGGSNSSATTWLRVAGSTTGVSALRIPSGFHPTSPADGDEWRVAAARYMAYNGIVYEYLTVPDGGAALQQIRRNAANTAYEHIYAPYELKYQNSGGEINIQNTTTATSLMSGVGSTTAITPGATGTKVVFEATGYIYTTSGTPQASIAFNAGDGSVSTGPVTLPPSLTAAQFILTFKRVASGTSYRYNWQLNIDDNGTLKTVGVGSFSSSGWPGFSTSPTVTWAWATASTSNRIRIFTAEWEVFRNQ